VKKRLRDPQDNHYNIFGKSACSHTSSGKKPLPFSEICGICGKK
jgi:hypothetical protein